MVYEIITERIIELLKAGTVPWRKPWRSSAPANLISKKPYRGINAFLLNSLSFESPYFVTFNQAKQLGGSVRRGEKGAPVVFWQFIEKQTEDGKKEIPLLRYYTVFNISQCEGIPVPAVQTSTVNSIAACECIIEGMPNRAQIEHGGNEAVYIPKLDRIQMPAKASFGSAEEYYSTLFHELIHSTGHQARLGRKGVIEAAYFGSQSYCAEELIAEMGSSFLCGEAGIETATIENSAAYIKGWLTKFRSDKWMIVSAAGQAQKAADYVLGV
jgi:antirestriction protein ArdC